MRQSEIKLSQFYKIVFDRIIELKAKINGLRLSETNAKNEEEREYILEQIYFAKDRLAINEEFEKELLKVIK